MKRRLPALLLALLLFAFPAVADPTSSVGVVFSPHRGATEAVLTLIREAKSSLRIAAYSFTSKEIAKALVEAHRRGVVVQVVLDKSNARAKYTSATFLANMGIPTRINFKYAIMHNKFMVIDSVTVETGSFNYTKAAEENNAENLLILRNQSDVAAQYLNEWQRLWDESEAFQPQE